MSIKLITNQDIIDAGCLNVELTIDVIENAFKAFKSGNVILPDKISQVFNKETQDRINCMPSTLLKEKISGVKWVSVFPNNPLLYRIPNVSGLIILSEIETGRPIAVMDATLITSFRTACVGTIGAKYLARKDSKTYGTIGTGEQAKMHYKCIKELFPEINTCFVASRCEESEQKFVDEMKELFPEVEYIKCCSDYNKASSDSDIIVTAVSCQKPLLKADYIKKGAFYCHVGGWEDEYSVPLKADKIVCDDWSSLKHRGSPTIARMYSEGILKDSNIYANIVDIIDGTAIPRENDYEFIYFNSIGLAYVDIAVAYNFFNTVNEKKIGFDWTNE